MKVKKGVVVNNKLDKTLIIIVENYKTDPKYKKRYKVTKKFHAHNPENKKFEIGEKVEIYETRPLSKLKKWTIVKPEQPKK